MIKLLEGIDTVGEEVKCDTCGAIVHCEDDDWEEVSYYYHGYERTNQTIDCPSCYCCIYRWEDR